MTTEPRPTEKTPQDARAAAHTATPDLAAPATGTLAPPETPAYSQSAPGPAQSIPAAALSSATASDPVPQPQFQAAAPPALAAPTAIAAQTAIASLPQPAAQLAKAFVALGSTAYSDGPQQLIIRLDPVELGHIQIRIDRPADGPAHVVLAVERSDTLMMLLQDRPHLNQALDAAGVPPDGRILRFDLTPAGAGAGHDRSAGGGPDGQPGQGSGDGASGNRAPSDDTSRRPFPGPGRAAWTRTGIDITA